MPPVRIGCSGWQYKDWRGRLYPEGLGQPRWLQRYAEVFDTVEVNSTFYRLAKPEAVARWVEQTPPDFLFTIKASRYLTHIKRLRPMDQGVSRFYESIEPLARSPKMGPVLWQQPENFHRDDDAWPTRSTASRRGGIASSSATKAGSRARCTTCCAAAALRSSSGTIRSAPSSRTR